MATSTPPTKSAGFRPPTNKPPLTTFSSEPNEEDRGRDILVFLTDNIDRLIRLARHSDTQSTPIFMELLQQRIEWVQQEMATEGMLQESPAAPLGIDDDPYDLTSINVEFEDKRRKAYQSLIDRLGQAQWSLLLRMTDQSESDEPSL